MKNLRILILVLVGLIGPLSGAEGLSPAEGEPEERVIDSISYTAPSSRPSVGHCCPDGRWRDGLEVFGQALYWKWSGKRTPYAFQFLTIVPPNLVLSDIPITYNPDYQWGFRVGIALRPCTRCTYAELSYLRLDHTERVGAFGQAIGFDPFFGQEGFVTARFGNEYQNIDLTLGYYLYRKGCTAFHLHGGGRWVFLEERTQIEGPTTLGAGRLKGHNRFNGAALKLGLGGDVGLFCLKVFGEFDLLALLGTQTSYEEFTEPGRLVIRPEPSSVRATTGMGAKIGVKCQHLFRCCMIDAEVGLEVQNCYDVLRPSIRATDIGIQLSDNDGGFTGPYAGLRVIY